MKSLKPVSITASISSSPCNRSSRPGRALRPVEDLDDFNVGRSDAVHDPIWSLDQLADVGPVVVRGPCSPAHRMAPTRSACGCRPAT